MEVKQIIAEIKEKMDQRGGHKDNPCRAIRESCKKNTGVN